MKEKRENWLVLLILIVGIINLNSCELLSDGDGVYPVEVQLSMVETQKSLKTNTPHVEDVSLSINAISLGNNVAERFYMSPENSTFLLTPSDSSKLLFKDYIPKDQFRSFDVSIGNFLPDSSSDFNNPHFLKGVFNQEQFTLELPDTLDLSFEFNPVLNVENEKDAKAIIILQVDQANWFIDKDENILNPSDTTDVAVIFSNIKNSISVYYEIIREGCSHPKGKCDNIGRGKDQEALVEVEGDTGSENADSLFFKVTLSEGLDDTVRINYATSDNSAKEHEDYSPTSGILLLLPGEITKEIPVAIIDDSLKEPDERFTLTLNNVEGANLNKGKSRTQGIIIDDDNSGNGNGGNGGGNGNGTD